MPKVSIVIPNYNYGRFADRFFHSIAKQTFSLAHTEIIFVDDGSTDNSLDQAKKWAQRIQCDRFEILTPLRTGKPGSVRNNGLEKAHGDFLLSLDPDDTIHPDYISICLRTLENNPDIDLVYTDYLEKGMADAVVRLPDFKPVLLRTQNPLPPAAMYRRSLWDSGIRYRNNTEYEDWDYWIQCLSAGASFQRIPEVLYCYELHDCNYSLTAQKNDGHAKAQIVLNNPGFFHPLVENWATGFMKKRLHSQAFQRGYIPNPNDVRELLKFVERQVLSNEVAS